MPAGLKVQTSSKTGLAMFVTAEDGGAIPVQPAAGQPTPRPMDFLAQYGSLFGITDRTRQLVVRQTTRDSLGFTHTTYRQVHQGIPVFGGTIRIHQNAAGQITAANGYFFPISSKLRTTAAVSATQAQATARAAVQRGSPKVERSELVIVDPGWYGDRFIGSRLAHHIVLGDPDATLLEGFFVDAHTGRILDQWTMLPTAKDREVYDLCGSSDCCCEHDSPGCADDACEAAVCEVDPTCCTKEWTESCAFEAFFVCNIDCFTLPLARSEGDPVVLGRDDVNAVYDYFGDTYDYFLRAFGRDSINGRGLTMVGLVNIPLGCPNASWSPFALQMSFCPGVVSDETIGHELTHGVTQFTADLLYQNQSGQLNESFSDVFGELIDLFNGNAAFVGTPGGSPWPQHPTGPGVDTPNNRRSSGATACSPSPAYPDGVRWVLGEDDEAFGGAIRDMWNPTCFGDPDRANSPLMPCFPFDNGGVHFGSGVPNHAFSIITDGKTFNGFAVTGIGPIKSGAIWYRALTEYLTELSDFQAAYAALNQAAADLVDTTPNDPRTGLPSDSAFTAADAAELDKALRAVEMDTPGRCGKEFFILSTTPPTACGEGRTLFLEDFEDGAESWSVGVCTELEVPRDNPSSSCDESSGPPPTAYHWVRASGLPGGREGTAMFAEDPFLFNLADESAVHELISPEIVLPEGLVSPTLSFAHYMDVELGYDGGTVQIKVDDGEFQDVITTDFLYNPYTTFLYEADFGNSNPLQGSRAWSGFGGWGTTVINLASSNLGARSGSTIQIKFRLGKDAFGGIDGWYVDDVRVFDCDCNGNGVPDSQDISSGFSQDCQPNGVPDECEGGCVPVPGGGGGAAGTPKVPTVSIQVSPLSGLSPLTVSFRANAPESDSAIVSAVWDFGDGSTPDNRAVTEHTYRLSGTATESFLATFTVTDEEGDVGQKSVLITVFSGEEVEPPGTITESAVRIVVQIPGTSTDVGDSAALGERLELSVDTSQIVGTPQGVSWSLGDGSTASSFIVQHTYDIAGTFPISVVVTSQTSSGDSITFPASRLITILAPPNGNDNTEGNANDNSGPPSGGGDGGVACGLGLLMPMLGMFGLAVARRLRLV